VPRTDIDVVELIKFNPTETSPEIIKTEWMFLGIHARLVSAVLQGFTKPKTARRTH
jgi:hypothetical protein